MLNYTEAFLFMRFGEDMRWAGWPAGDFARFVQELTAPTIPGYTSEIYSPTPEELGSQWQRA